MEIQETQISKEKAPIIKKKSKLFWLIIIALVLIVVLVLFLSSNQKSRQNQEQQPAQEQPLVNPPPLPGQTILPKDQLPIGITKDMILDENAEILQSYEYVDEETRQKQSTVRYTTAINFDEIKGKYERFLGKNDWLFVFDSESTNGDLVSLRGVNLKMGEELNIVISIDKEALQTVIDLTGISQIKN